MCGIVGVFNSKDASVLAKTALKTMEHRGTDSVDCFSKGNYAFGHCLHSIVGFVKQPIVGKGVFISNCEIYNWKELSRKYYLDAKNDSYLLFLLLEKKGIGKVKEVLSEIDGVYAFAYLLDSKLVLARDILGIKPLWFASSGTFAFASEKRALESMDFIDPIELNPRKILVYDVRDNRFSFSERDFFKITPQIDLPKEKISSELVSLLQSAVKKRVPDKKFGLLFSGGLDSAFLALMLKKLGCDFTCYTAVLDNASMKEPEDLKHAIKAAELIGLKLKVVKIKQKDVESHLKKIVPLISDSNVVKVGVALPFFAACEQARKDRCKVVFSGLGADELFAGYARYEKSTDVNAECLSVLLKMYERDTYRDDVITMYNNLELRLPFLDSKLVEFALRIPGKYKLEGDKRKIILVDSAIKYGLPETIARRKKKAAQYGSNFHKAIERLAKDSKMSSSSYLRRFYPKHNLKLGALVSSGKDSIYSMHVMMKQNYDIGCMITLRSSNPDSFMFHTPAIDMVKLQSKSIGIPLLEYETKGEKELELEDLKSALKLAKEKYGIEGLVTGALFSTYQRNRIEEVCDSLGLKIFAPLWHMDQETELREIVGRGFKFIIVKVCSDGLDKSWLNRVITEEDIDKLVNLSKKFGFNVAFEGGEAETLMVDGPIFRKPIRIVDSEIREESGNVAELMIKKAELT